MAQSSTAEQRNKEYQQSNHDNDIFEEGSTKSILARASISHSRQGWQYLVQRILNNEFSNELQLLQRQLDSNIFQRVRHRSTNEYKMEVNECIYKVQNLPLLCLPNRETMKSILVRSASTLRYSTIKAHTAHSMINPAMVQLGIVLKLSELEDQTDREQYRLLPQKRVTIIPPSESTIRTSHKRTSFIEGNSLVLASPRWRPSIDEQYFSSLDSRPQPSFPTNQRSSDDVRQMILQAIRTNSYPNAQGHSEFFSSLNNLLAHKRHQSSAVDIVQDNNLPRLSTRSISYGFGLGTKTLTTSHDQNKIQQEHLVASPNYRLPANKIDLDLNQQENLRRTGSFKRKSEII